MFLVFVSSNTYNQGSHKLNFQLQILLPKIQESFSENSKWLLHCVQDNFVLQQS